jgi:flagellar hook-associated protein 3 FlgL
MSLRITQSILYSRSLRDIHSATLGRLKSQEEIATGKRVNRPSDDAAATLRILPLRSTIADLSRMTDNGLQARDALNSGAAATEDALSLMARLRELTTQAANGSVSPSDRVSLANEVDQMMRQMMTIANTRVASRYLFGGTAADGNPFTLVEDAGGTRVRYSGNQDQLDLEVAPEVRVAITAVGERMFLGRERTATTITGSTGAAPSGAADSGVGFGRLTVTHGSLVVPGSPAWFAGTAATTALGNHTLTFTTAPDALSVNGGPPQTFTGPGPHAFAVPGSTGTLSLEVSGPVVASSHNVTSTARLSTDGGETSVEVTDFSPGAEVQVYNAYDGGITNVAVAGLTRTGTDQIEYGGTFDVFTAMLAVRDIMQNDAGLSVQEVTSRLTSLLDDVDRANEFLLEGVRDFGSRAQQMEFLGNRVERLKGLREEVLSEVQDADLAGSILRMQQQDFAYQASLQVSSRIVQTSLMDYLR